jgi:hypothetical protein
MAWKAGQPSDVIKWQVKFVARKKTGLEIVKKHLQGF